MPWEKQFDVEAVRKKAMVLFWSRGYESTSMEQLLSSMGIQRGSFYATFRSKRDTLLEALRLYDSQRHASFEVLTQKASSRELIQQFFRSVADEASASDGRRGCFLVNSALELSSKDPEVAEIVGRAFDETELFFREALAAGVQRGEFPRALDVDGLAASLLSMLLGLRVLARAGSKTRAIEAVVQNVAVLLKAEGERHAD